LGALSNGDAEIRVVFAGGGARGFAHVGVLHALRRDGYAPSVLVGVSMGALVATTYGLNPGWYAALQAMDISGFPRPPDFSGRGVMASIRKAVMAERALQQMYFGWGFGQPAVEWGVALLHRLIGAQPIEACCVPVFVCATDLLTGKRVVFSAGPCVGAVYASSALAGIVPPARIGGQVLVDGGYSDIAPIDVARAAGVRTCVDGVSYAPHGFADVGALGCDVYLFSAYKTYGPHQGIMVIREDFGQALPNQGHHFNGGTLYKRFTPAGPDHAQVAACAGMADYIEALSAHHGGPAGGAGAARHAHDVMRAQEVAVLQPLLDYLAARNDLRLIGPRRAAGRAPTVAVELRGPGEEAARALAAHGIMAGGGNFYAQRPLGAMGIDTEKGVLRLSFVHYTTRAEVDALIAALDQVL